MSVLKDLRKLLEEMPNLPIMRPTQCKAAGHVWFYATGGCSTDEPPDDLRCDCGMFSWKMAKTLSEKAVQND